MLGVKRKITSEVQLFQNSARFSENNDVMININEERLFGSRDEFVLKAWAQKIECERELIDERMQRMRKRVQSAGDAK